MSFGPIRILLLFVALLAGVLAWLWVDENGKLRNVGWVPPTALSPGVANDAGAPVPDARATNPALFLAVLERPVFAPDRRPPPPPAPPPPPDPMANIQILGVFSGPVGGVIARVDGKARRVRINDEVGSWTLKSIEGRDVTFSQGEEKRQLRLNYANLGTVSPQIPTAALQVPAVSATGGGTFIQNLQDETRERTRRVNAIRAANGIPIPPP